ncbi:hypothetical protein [Sphingomonas sp. MS122]|uniref:hypothetical protein n=1 Tax=Sphingomonas sp. MS122 TaxID=3412683 RepID=UPI003C2AE326
MTLIPAARSPAHAAGGGELGDERVLAIDVQPSWRRRASGAGTKEGIATVSAKAGESESRIDQSMRAL